MRVRNSGRKVRSAASAAIVGLALSMVAAPHASAVVTQNVSPRAIYDNNVDVQLASVTFTAYASWDYLITGKLVVDGATTRLLVGTRVSCSGTVGSQTSRNIISSDPATTTYARYLLDPAAGSVTCTFVVHSLPPGYTPDGADHFDVLSGSYLQVLPVSNDAAMAYQSPDQYLTNGQAYDANVLSYTAPPYAESVHAIGDVSVTNCITGDNPAVCVDGPNQVDAVIKVKFQILQWNVAHDGYCKQTNVPSSGYQNVTITWEAHHTKISQEATATISTAADCSRQFRIKTYVGSVSGNAVAIVGPGDHLSIPTRFSESVAMPEPLP